MGKADFLNMGVHVVRIAVFALPGKWNLGT
jgi:hypothetical protein